MNNSHIIHASLVVVAVGLAMVAAGILLGKWLKFRDNYSHPNVHPIPVAFGNDGALLQHHLDSAPSTPRSEDQKMANWKTDLPSSKSQQMGQKSIDDHKLTGPVGIKPVQMKSTSDPIGKDTSKTPMPKASKVKSASPKSARVKGATVTKSNPFLKKGGKK